MTLEGVILSEISQTEKDKDCMIPCICTKNNEILPFAATWMDTDYHTK